jgi:hypothetical protein
MEKVCSQCSAPFEVTNDDLAFYDKVSPVFGGKKYAIPPPTHCPECRQQRRLAWRNEHNIYNRQCDLCNRNIVSAHSANAEYPVYCVTCWWGDKWNPLEFGIDLDQSVPFLDQFKELQKSVPQLAMQNDNGIESENSEYCYDISRAKNCYRLIGSWYDEECHYSMAINYSRFVVDCHTLCNNCELLYECLDSQRLYHCAYLLNSENCKDCFFGRDLKGCTDCLACYGLRHKRFYIFNEPHTEEEYRGKMKELNLGSYRNIELMCKKFNEWSLKFPHLYSHQQNCEDCIGNNLLNCKNVLGYSTSNGEYCKFIDRCDGPKIPTTL